MRKAVFSTGMLMSMNVIKAVEGSRTILFGTHSRIGLDFGVVPIPSATGPGLKFVYYSSK
jgi:hypothetical protein